MADYPTSIATYGQSKFHRTSNLGLTELVGALSTSSMTIVVLDAASITAWPTANFCIRIDNELIFITSRTGNILTVGARNFGGTVAAAHADLTQARVVHTSDVIQYLIGEVIAVQTALGVNLGNISAVSNNQTVTGDWLFDHNLRWKSDTAFIGILDHAISETRTWTLPNASGTLLLSPALTAGSVVFAASSTTLGQDNSNLFYDDTNNVLGVRTATPATPVSGLTPTGISVKAQAGASKAAIAIDHTGMNDASNRGLFISTGSTTVDTTTAIGILNTGQSDGIYINNKGPGTGSPTPTGIGIDLNSDGAGGEYFTTYGGLGLQIWNFSSVATGGIGLYLRNVQAANTSLLLKFTTIANAISITPADDTTGSLQGVMVKLNSNAGVTQWSVSRNGYALGRGGLELAGAGTNDKNPNSIATASTNGSNTLTFTDTTAGSPNKKHIRVLSDKLEVINSAYSAAIFRLTDTGDITSSHLLTGTITIGGTFVPDANNTRTLGNTSTPLVFSSVATRQVSSDDALTLLAGGTNKNVILRTAAAGSVVIRPSPATYGANTPTLDFRQDDNAGTPVDTLIGRLKFFFSGTNKDVLMDMDAFASDGTSNARMRLFRNTNTTGNREIQIFKGDGTTTQTIALDAANGDITKIRRITFDDVTGAGAGYLAIATNDGTSSEGAPTIRLQFKNNTDRNKIRWTNPSGVAVVDVMAHHTNFTNAAQHKAYEIKTTIDDTTSAPMVTRFRTGWGTGGGAGGLYTDVRFLDIADFSITNETGYGPNGVGGTDVQFPAPPVIMKFRHADGVWTGGATVRDIFTIRSAYAADLSVNADIDPFSALGTTQVALRFFRNTTTTGSRLFQIFKGDGSLTKTFEINADTGAVTIAGAHTGTGNITITKANPTLSLTTTSAPTGTTQIIYGDIGGGHRLQIDPAVDDATSAVEASFFRSTNTTGTRTFRLYKGDNTSAAAFTISVDAGTFTVMPTLATDLNPNITNNRSLGTASLAYSNISLRNAISDSDITVTPASAKNILFRDGTTNTKIAKWNLSGISASTTRTISAPDLNGRIRVALEPSGDTSGATDATNIQGAITTIAALGGGVVDLSGGTFYVSSAISITASKVAIRGEGRSTIIRAVSGLNADVISVTGSGTKDVAFLDFQIDGNSAGQIAGSGILLNAPYSSGDSRIYVYNVFIESPKEDGIEVVGDTREVFLVGVFVRNAGGNSFTFGGSDHKLLNCVSEGSGNHGFNFSGATSGANTQASNCKAFGSGTITAGGEGFFLSGASNIQLANCQAQENKYDGFVISGGLRHILTNCRSESNSRSGASAGDGFVVKASNFGSILSGCMAVDLKTPKFQAYGLRLDGAGTTGLVIIGCNFNAADNLTGDIITSGGFVTASSLFRAIWSETTIGDTFNGKIVFRGSVAFNDILTHANTAERTHTFPDVTGTIVLREGTETLSGIKTFSAMGDITFDAGSATRTVKRADTIGLIRFQGGTGSGNGGQVLVTGSGHALVSQVILRTPDGAASEVSRMIVSGGATTATITWQQAVHTGMVWSGDPTPSTNAARSLGSLTAVMLNVYTRNLISDDAIIISAGGTNKTVTIKQSGTGDIILGSGTGTTVVAIDGAAASGRDLAFRTAGSNRWILRTDNSAESGANAGSNLSLISRDDSGGILGTVFSATRSSGQVVVNAFGATGTVDLRQQGVTKLQINTSGNVSLTDAVDVIVGSTTGSKIATAASQKLGFFGATPVVQITGSTDVLAGLVTLGFRAASSNPPLNLGTGALTAGTISGTGGAFTGDVTITKATPAVNLVDNVSAAQGTYFLSINQIAGGFRMTLDGTMTDGVSNVEIAYFRNMSTTGTRLFKLFRGDGTANTSWIVSAATGQMGIGDSAASDSSAIIRINPTVAPTGSSSVYSASAVDNNTTIAFATSPQTGDYRAWLMQQRTLTNPSAGTITNATTLLIGGAPVAGTNMTITNARSLWVLSGIAQFDSRVTVSATTGSVALLGTTTTVNANVGVGIRTAATGSGSTFDSWMNFITGTTTFTGEQSGDFLGVTFGTPTVASDTVSTVARAATVKITAAPAAGANVTITSSYAMWAIGNIRLDGNLLPDATNTRNIGAAATAYTAVFSRAVTSDDALTLSAGGTNKNVVLTPVGTGVVQVTKDLQPNANNTLALGGAAIVFTSVFARAVTSDDALAIGSGGSNKDITFTPTGTGLVKVRDSNDITKIFVLAPSAFSTGVTGTITASATANRTWTLPDSTGTVAILSLAQTWTANQTYSADLLFNATNARSIGSASVVAAAVYSRALTSDDALALSAGGSNKNITITPTGTGVIQIAKDLQPNANNTLAIGGSSLVFTTAYARALTSDDALALAAGGSNKSISLTPTGTGSVNIGISGTAANPSLTVNDADTGFFLQAANVLSAAIAGAEAARLSEPTDGNTALLIRRNVGAVFTLEQVSMGAADSGGAGFKVLRVPN